MVVLSLFLPVSPALILPPAAARAGLGERYFIVGIGIVLIVPAVAIARTGRINALVPEVVPWQLHLQRQTIGGVHDGAVTHIGPRLWLLHNQSLIHCTVSVPPPGLNPALPASTSSGGSGFRSPGVGGRGARGA